jgi:dihydrofolate synthase/folylpolyglutamate synthase
VAALAEALEDFLAGRPLVAVVSVLDDKDAAAMLAALLPLCDRIVCTSNANPRALSPATLQSLAGQISDVQSDVQADPHAALATARRLAAASDPPGVALATGSIYLIADLRRSEPGRRASAL